jgi:plastocyanin
MRFVKTGLPCAALALLAAPIACAPTPGPAGPRSQVALAAPAAPAAAAAKAGDWGTLKGQVVWAGGAVPPRDKLDVTKDPAECLKKGPLYSEKYVVNPKNKGVRWVLVWLTDADSPTKAVPVHPALKPIKDKVVVMDQPCCMFEPHVVGLREGQTIEFKNSAKIPHNVKVDGGAKGPNINPILPPGASHKEENVEARKFPIPVSCSIHPWMKGWVGVFKGPYFAVTDENGHFEMKNAPAGKFRLMAWQEEQGWVAGDDGKPSSKGQLIEIKAGGATDVKLEMKPSKD